jgi:hypothetical protein
MYRNYVTFSRFHFSLTFVDKAIAYLDNRLYPDRLPSLKLQILCLSVQAAILTTLLFLHNLRMGSYKLGCTDLERLEKPATDKHCGLVGTILIIRNHISTAYMIKS